MRIEDCVGKGRQVTEIGTNENRLCKSWCKLKYWWNRHKINILWTWGENLARPNVNLEVAKTICKLIAFPVRPEIRENVNWSIANGTKNNH